jgi:hypothetical protein
MMQMCRFLSRKLKAESSKLLSEAEGETQIGSLDLRLSALSFPLSAKKSAHLHI